MGRRDWITGLLFARIISLSTPLGMDSMSFIDFPECRLLQAVTSLLQDNYAAIGRVFSFSVCTTQMNRASFELEISHFLQSRSECFFPMTKPRAMVQINDDSNKQASKQSTNNLIQMSNDSRGMTSTFLKQISFKRDAVYIFSTKVPIFQC